MVALILRYNFQLNSVTLFERGVVDNRQINCYKVVPTIRSVNVGASASSCMTSRIRSPSLSKSDESISSSSQNVPSQTRIASTQAASLTVFIYFGSVDLACAQNFSTIVSLPCVPILRRSVPIFLALSHPFWQKSREKSKTPFFLFSSQITSF